MNNAFTARLQQKKRTIGFPKEEPQLPERFRGRPRISGDACPGDCRRCIDACPVGAISCEGKRRIDLGKCLFCGDCEKQCPAGSIAFTNEFRLAVRERGDLVASGDPYPLARMLEAKMLKIFGRSLKLRQVSAGGCNACESDLNVLNTVVFDLGRFGIQFVASPRHADGLVITGPITRNMRDALLKTWEATPSPKLVIAVGACAISGGLFRDHPETCNGAERLLPIDLYIPGCPPHPLTILDGMLRLLDKL
jgi:Ni,Fe-hydrogenase III small subunit/NAD-dependent dihydropyrimidine dehydrogenase PreA subunit